MKIKILLFAGACFIARHIAAQNLWPREISISYLGETVTHPGLKVNAYYHIHDWSKVRKTKIGKERKFEKTIMFSPGVGIFYHKAYQTGLMVLPELSYLRKKENGNFRGLSIGFGYLRTWMDEVYTMDANDRIKRKFYGQNQLLASVGATFGKVFEVNNGSRLGVYLKPQFQLAFPSAAKKVSYLMLETGIKLSLK